MALQHCGDADLMLKLSTAIYNVECLSAALVQLVQLVQT
jgi:hypothetical protein